LSLFSSLIELDIFFNLLNPNSNLLSLFSFLMESGIVLIALYFSFNLNNLFHLIFACLGNFFIEFLAKFSHLKFLSPSTDLGIFLNPILASFSGFQYFSAIFLDALEQKEIAPLTFLNWLLNLGFP